MTQDPHETGFARGYRKAQEAHDAYQTQSVYPVTYPTHIPPPVDYTMPILVGCLTALLIALMFLVSRRRK